ncbi:hypothetical protein Tco_1571958, partial [Tanacetum coccineum]
KNKAGVGIKIPSCMITDEMKLTENYRMYAAVFGIDIPTNQSQPIESTQGTHRTTSAPRTPNPDVDEGESKTIQLSIAEQKSHDDFEAKQNEKKVKDDCKHNSTRTIQADMAKMIANTIQQERENLCHIIWTFLITHGL